MKTKLFILLACLFMSKALLAQAISWPVDTVTKKITFKEVVSAAGISQDMAYLKAKIWLSKTFKSAKDAIQLDEKQAGLLVIKGVSTFYVNDPSAEPTDPVAVYLMHQINLAFKAGKYRYIITDLAFDSPSHFEGIVPAESWLMPPADWEKQIAEGIEKQGYSKKKTQRKVAKALAAQANMQAQYAAQTQKVLESLIASLKAAMASNLLTDADW